MARNAQFGFGVGSCQDHKPSRSDLYSSVLATTKNMARNPHIEIGAGRCFIWTYTSSQKKFPCVCRRKWHATRSWDLGLGVVKIKPSRSDWYSSVLATTNNMARNPHIEFGGKGCLILIQNWLTYFTNSDSGSYNVHLPVISCLYAIVEGITVLVVKNGPQPAHWIWRLLCISAGQFLRAISCLYVLVVRFHVILEENGPQPAHWNWRFLCTSAGQFVRVISCLYALAERIPVFVEKNGTQPAHWIGRQRLFEWSQLILKPDDL